MIICLMYENVLKASASWRFDWFIDNYVHLFCHVAYRYKSKKYGASLACCYENKISNCLVYENRQKAFIKSH